MKNCAVAITVDGWTAAAVEPPAFRVGQPVTGTVHVWVHDRVKCEGLDVALAMDPTHPGYGVGRAGDGPKVRLFEGTWEPGEYDYRFEVPGAPLPSYEGTCVGWKWMVRAEVSIPFAVDAKGEAELRVIPPGPPAALEVTTPPPDQQQPGRSLPPALVVTGLATVLTAGAFVTGIVLHTREMASEDVSGALAALGFWGMLAFLVATIWQLVRWRGRGGSRWQAAVELEHRPSARTYREGASHGACIACRAKPAPGPAIARVVARLAVREFARWSTGTGDSRKTVTREHTVAVREHELRQVEPNCWAGEIPLLDAAEAPPFSVGEPPDRGLIWQVDIDVHRRQGGEAERTSRLLRIAPRW